MTKEFLYVGYYIDEDGNFILKVGTTSNLKRRQAQHNNAYRKAKHNPMAEGEEFNYVWWLPLSKYNTLRYEDKTKEKWIAEGIGEYIRNDRFICKEVPRSVTITIKKSYEIIF